MKNCWKWHLYEFDTLKQAKDCIKGDYGKSIEKYLEYKDLDKIKHYENGHLVGYVVISTDKEGYPYFSKTLKVKFPI